MFFFHRDDRDIIKKGARNALAALAYVIAVVAVMAILRNINLGEDGILAPVGFLLLLVLSASVMGTVIFGGPVMLYIDGKKKEAVRLVAWTIGSLAAITAFVLVAMTLMGAWL